VKEFEARVRHLGEEIEFIPASEPFEVGSTRYHGGVRIIENASIQPARHYQAMRRRAEAVGARVVGHTEVTGIVREDRDFEVHTARGTVRARDVLIATNGYSGRLSPWIARRLAPINAYMIATEPLSDNLAKSVLPAHRTYNDNRRSGNYMQLSPDGKRLLFGGRTGRLPSSLRQLAGDLYREMVFFFPQLEGVKVAHAWTGRCAATGIIFRAPASMTACTTRSDIASPAMRWRRISASRRLGASSAKPMPTPSSRRTISRGFR